MFISDVTSDGDSPMAPNDYATEVCDGELFINDLGATTPKTPVRLSTETPDDDYDDDDEEGVITTMMLGEEGDRAGGNGHGDDEDEGIVTTMMLGEEGDRGGQ